MVINLPQLRNAHAHVNNPSRRGPFEPRTAGNFVRWFTNLRRY
jgi:hypothetical protein